MALYRVSLRQALRSGATTRWKWSNTFYRDDVSAEDAANAIRQAWVSYLSNAAKDIVFAYEVYATSLTSGDDDFAVVPIADVQQPGQITSGSSEVYNPNVCTAVTLRATAGRPSRKFWRPGLQEEDVIGGLAVSGAIVSAISVAFNDMLANQLIFDPDGQRLLSVATVRISTRRLGREAFADLPSPPSS